jgi:hypothetical protein
MKVLTTLFVALLFLFSTWYIAMPRTTLHFNENGIDEIRYRWVTDDRVYRGTLTPGEKTTEPGALFPADAFFMIVEWWINRNYKGCAKVIPKWYGTDMYLDKNGDIDLSLEGDTDLDRVMFCPRQRSPEIEMACRPC